MRLFVTFLCLVSMLSCTEHSPLSRPTETANLATDSLSKWQVVEPASLGLSEKQLLKIHADIATGQYGWIDSFLVVRHGRIAFEHYYEHDYAKIYGVEARTPGPLVVQNWSGPYNYFNAFWHPYYKGSDLHSMQSVTKSLVSAVIGIAIKRGDFPDIDTPVLSFFDVNEILNVDDAKRAMTLRDLLTMSDGLSWDEGVPYSDPNNTFTIMARSPDWVKYTLNQPMAYQPGTEFNYNSGSSLVLGHIFLLATGIDIETYAVEHLLQPLGIERYEWKRTPFGLADTQEGLFLSTRDIAKITMLFLNNGRWQDVQIIPQAWVSDSLRPAFTLSDEVSTGYGYKWWSQSYQYQGEEFIAFLGKGFGGQRPIFLPDLDLVIVVTGWNILPDRPFLTAAEIIKRVTTAIDG